MTALAVWCGLFLGRARNERLAAEAIAAAGGKVIYDWQAEGLSEPQQPVWLRRLLGVHFFDRIVRVELDRYGGYQEDVKFSELASRFHSLSGLRDLWIWCVDLDQADYRALGRLKGIEKLGIGFRTTVDDQSAAAISKISSLRELNLNEVIITPAGLAEIAKLPRLENLRVSSHSPYGISTGRLIESLAKHRLTDAAADKIAECQTLRQLTLQTTVITDKGVERLCDLEGLESLVIQSSEITGESLHSIKQHKRIRWLGALDWQVANDDWGHLGESPSLAGLAVRLPYSPDGDAFLPHLATLHRLRVLRLWSYDITDADIHHLHDMSNLRELNLCLTEVQRVGSAADLLREALPACSITWPLTEQEEDAQGVDNFQRWDSSPPEVIRPQTD